MELDKILTMAAMRGTPAIGEAEEEDYLFCRIYPHFNKNRFVGNLSYVRVGIIVEHYCTEGNDVFTYELMNYNKGILCPMQDLLSLSEEELFQLELVWEYPVSIEIIMQCYSTAKEVLLSDNHPIGMWKEYL